MVDHKNIQARSVARVDGRRGFTLTEMAIALGVIGTILGGIWAAAGHVSSANKTQRAAAEAAQIVTGYRALYGTNGIDTTTTFQDVTCLGVDNGYFPSETTNGGACASLNYATYPRNQWGGSIVVQADAPSNVLLVMFTNLPQDACNSVATALFGSSLDFNFEGIGNTGGYSHQYLGLVHGQTSGTPWPPSTINGLCFADSSNFVQVGYIAR